MLTGNVDRVSRTEIIGWAADPFDPDATVDVVVLIDGCLQWKLGADQPRDDLARIGGFGHGRHGFVCRFPQELSPDSPHALTIAFAANGRPLMHGQTRLDAAASPTKSAKAAAPSFDNR